MCRKFPGRLVLGIDARGGRVATEGWQSTSDVPATELARRFAGEPLAAVVYTDIATDGMMAGPNVAEMAAMQAAVEWPVVASGGVTTRKTWPDWPPCPWPAALSAGPCMKEH